MHSHLDYKLQSSDDQTKTKPVSVNAPQVMQESHINGPRNCPNGRSEETQIMKILINVSKVKMVK